MTQLIIGAVLSGAALDAKASAPKECRIDPARALSWSEFASVTPDA